MKSIHPSGSRNGAPATGRTKVDPFFHSMKIYTRAGDGGETSLFGGTRVPKDNRRIEAYGTVDELNAHLGVVRSLNPPEALAKMLVVLQEELFVLGAELASPRAAEALPRINAGAVVRIEGWIDGLEETLEPLKTFILPAGTLVASHLHVARTVCRRAERLVVALARTEPVGGDVLIYLNRLSDLLFVMARVANRTASQAETPWKPSR